MVLVEIKKPFFCSNVLSTLHFGSCVWSVILLSFFVALCLIDKGYQLTIFPLLLQIRKTIFESLSRLDVTWVIYSLISSSNRLAKYVQIIWPLVSCLSTYVYRKINLIYTVTAVCPFFFFFFFHFSEFLGYEQHNSMYKYNQDRWKADCIKLTFS